MTNDPFLSELLATPGLAGEILTSPEDLLPYGFDGTAALKGTASAVAFPESTEEVALLVNLCRKHGKAIVTRGSGTGLSGGSVPSEGCLVLCLLKMNRILELDSKNLTLRAQSGVVTKEISDAAEAAGLFYPPDPGSMKVSTIGGNVAENSGGLRGLKYGVTRDYVMGLTAVLADGSIVRFGGKCVKDVAGYSMKDLFIGSEGTLGIITEVLLKLLPKPPARRTMLALFSSMEEAAETVSQIIASKIIPCTLEFLDKTTLEAVEAYAKIGLPTTAEAVLLMESDGHESVVEAEAEIMSRIAREQGAFQVETARDATHAAELAAARRTAFSALARVRPTTILEDATVPRDQLATMVGFVRKVAEKYQLRVGTFGHFGDGNLHPTFLTDERDQEEFHRVEQAMSEIFDEAIRLGGTITGEHGVGLAKKPFLNRQFTNDSLRLMKTLRQSLDPEGLLNPGKLIDC